MRRARVSERFTITSSGDRCLGLLYECAGPDRWKKSGGDRLRQRPDLDDLEACRPDGSGAGRNQSPRQTMTRRLLEAAIKLAHAAHLARQSQLSDDNQAVRQGPVARVAVDGQGKTKVGGRLRDTDAARHIDEDVGLPE